MVSIAILVLAILYLNGYNVGHPMAVLGIISGGLSIIVMIAKIIKKHSDNG